MRTTLSKNGKKLGAPTKRTDKLVDTVLLGVSKGIPLTVVCRKVGIDQSQFWRWKEDDEDLKRRYQEARDLGFDAIATEILDIADDKSRDTTARGALNKEWVERSKLRVYARLQLLAKWDPKRYGDKMQHTGDGGGSIKLSVSSEDAAL